MIRPVPGCPEAKLHTDGAEQVYEPYSPTLHPPAAFSFGRATS